MQNVNVPYQNLVENAPVGVYRVADDGELLYVNDTFAQMVGFDTAKQFDSRTGELEYTDPADWTSFRERVEREGQVDRYEIEVRTQTGTTVDLLLSGSLADDVVTGYAIDVTERRRLEQKTADQAAALLELSVPIVQIWDGVTLATVIGTLDTERAQRLTEDLLTEITESGSRVALIDITGVPSIDTATAQHLIDTVNAVTLLGSDVVITGINPDIAQTLVHLGISMNDIMTRSSLSEGLELALDLLDKSVTSELDAAE